MTLDDHNSLFLCTENERAEVRKTFGLTEIHMTQGVDLIMEWFAKQPHLVQAGISPVIVEMMIVISKGSIERAKEKIDYFYRWRFFAPELMLNRESVLRNSEKIWDMYSIMPLPKLRDNRRIFVIKFSKNHPNPNLSEFYKRTCMIMDLRLRFDYMVGDIWIIDLKHIAWLQIITQNLMVLKKMSDLFTKALNWRMYGIHVINIPASASLLQRILDVFKQFVSSLIMSRVMIHESLEDLYKYVPKECLPEDYGGKALSTEKLTENLENEFRKSNIVKYLLECSKMVSNESIRPRDENSEEFLAGTFRKLDVD